MTDDSLAFEDKLELRSWGLPEYILQKYQNRGIKKMFPWQLECLMSENVLLGGNLLYSAPTSAGKTLVAEILALKTVLERKKKVIVILPFVSVVREKMIYFQDILCGSGIKVEGFMGSYNPPGGFKNVHLAVCTIEKANGLINRLLEERNFDDVGCIVVDELHLLGDSNRGYLLELLLTKIRYVCQKGIAPSIQIVGMSATLPNLDLLATWLNATLYHTEFRPIPLFEYLKIGRTVYKSPELNDSFELKTVVDIQNDPGDVVSLCLDTIIQGFSILVFCPTKNWCETLAVQISSEIKRLGNEKDDLAQSLRKQLNSRGIFDTLEQLKKTPAGLEKNLGKSVAFGVGYHHAGLTLDERDIIEGGFRQNIIRVLVATSTLSSGVNLPARRVIIRSPAFQGHCMDILTYKQMIGRAGRMGKDTAGESYLICTEQDKTWGQQLVTSCLPPVESCLGYGDLSSSLKRALLEVIAGGVVTSSDEVHEYTKCTLLAASTNDERLSRAIESCTNYLKENEFIKVDLDGGVLPSSLAEACLSSSVPPDQALWLLKELHKARQCFVLDSDLHALYQVTPYSICDNWQVDWMRVFSIWEELPPNLQKIGDLVGVEDRFLIRAMRSTINLTSEEYARKTSIHKRFYTSLALQDLINEVPLNDVAEKYGCTKGMLQSLQQSASTFAAMVTSFCRKLGWGGLEVILSELSARIQFGVQKELLDLLRLECMSGLMARALHTAGITTLSELASSTIPSIQLAINKAKPFQSEFIDTESQIKKNVHLPGRPGLSEKEAADLMIYEARRFLLKEMGVKTAEWEDNKTSVNASIYESPTIIPDDDKKDSLVMNNETSFKENIENEKPDDNIVLLNKRKFEKQDADVTYSQAQIKYGKSSQIELGLDICIEKKCEAVDKAMADTEIICTQNLEDVSPIKKTIEPLELIGKTIIPESQNLIFSQEVHELPQIPYDERIITQEIVYDKKEKDGIEVFKVPGVIGSDKKDEFLNENSLFAGISDSMSFPLFETNANLCSTYLQDGKKGCDKFSLEVMYGSPCRGDADFMGTLDCDLVNNSPAMKSSTPVNKIANEDFYNLSNNDLFSESPLNKGTSLNKQILDEFDPNWGGDSLLELSQNLDKSSHSHNSAIKKRKHSYLENENDKKRMKIENTFSTIIKNNTPTIKKTVIKTDSPSFGDSLMLNTQLENFVQANESKFLESPKKINTELPKDKSNTANKELELKCFSRTKSDGYLLKNHKNKTDHISMTDTLLASAFDGSFKLGDIIQECKNELNTEKLDDIHISDTEDLITGSPEKNQKSKRDLSLYRNKSYTSKSNIISSPKSSPNHNSSPLKYPPIGNDILKLHKSPNRRKKLVLTPITPEKYCHEQIRNSAAQQISSKARVQTSEEGSKASSVAQMLLSSSPEKKSGKHLFSLLPTPKDPEKHQQQENNALITQKSSSKTPQKQPLEIEKVSVTQPSISKISECVLANKIQASNDQKLYSKAQELKVQDEKKIPIAQPSPSKAPLNNLQEKNKFRNTQTVFTKESSVVDVLACDSSEKIVEEIMKLKELAIIIKTKTINDKETQQARIGGRIVKSVIKNVDVEPQFKFDEEALIGVYLYGGSKIYFFDMISLSTPNYRILKNLFSQQAIKLYAFNIRRQLNFFYKCCGYIISCKLFDLAIADWLLNPEENHKSLKEMAVEYLKSGNVSPSKLKNEISEEIKLIWDLQKELTKRLQKADLLKHFEGVEMPIQHTILFMELNGIGFKHDIANELWSSSTELMGKLEMEVFSLAKHKFALNSNSDLSKIKKELKILPENEADHPFMLTVQNWRKLFSLKTRNLSQLLFKQDGRCHCKSSTFSATGRIMLYDPDLQHIPRDFSVDDKLFSLRSAFIASPGNVLVSADYSQLELRILAHFSQDPVLVPLLRKGDDVFKNIAAEWNGISTDKVNDELRHQVKQLTYGIIYGMGDKALGEALGKTAAEASMLSAKFKRSFPKMDEFVKRTIEECRKTGQIKTLTGRVRLLPGINSSNSQVKAQAERQAVNSKIQGSASDIAKKAMIEIENNLNRTFPGRSNLPSPCHSSHLVLQLHDEFIYEVEESIATQFVPVLKNTMETSTFLSVPLPVVVKSGKSWGELWPL